MSCLPPGFQSLPLAARLSGGEPLLSLANRGSAFLFMWANFFPIFASMFLKYSIIFEKIWRGHTVCWRPGDRWAQCWCSSRDPSLARTDWIPANNLDYNAQKTTSYFEMSVRMLDIIQHVVTNFTNQHRILILFCAGLFQFCTWNVRWIQGIFRISKCRYLTDSLEMHLLREEKKKKRTDLFALVHIGSRQFRLSEQIEHAFVFGTLEANQSAVFVNWPVTQQVVDLTGRRLTGLLLQVIHSSTFHHFDLLSTCLIELSSSKNSSKHTCSDSLSPLLRKSAHSFISTRNSWARTRLSTGTKYLLRSVLLSKVLILPR